jgi:lysozyme
MDDINTALGLAVPLVFPAEGFKSVAYLDRLAKPPVWTIGHGSTRVNGQPVHAGMTCTLTQADAWAAADLTSSARQVLACVLVGLTAPQLGALTSLVYNIGIGNFHASNILTALNQGHYQTAADRFLEYDHAGGVELGGLETRRKRERALFLRTAADAPMVDATAALNDAEINRLADDPAQPHEGA